MDKIMAYIKMKVAMLEYAIENNPDDDSKLMCLIRNIDNALEEMKTWIVEIRR